MADAGDEGRCWQSTLEYGWDVCTSHGWCGRSAANVSWAMTRYDWCRQPMSDIAWPLCAGKGRYWKANPDWPLSDLQSPCWCGRSMPDFSWALCITNMAWSILHAIGRCRLLGEHRPWVMLPIFVRRMSPCWWAHATTNACRPSLMMYVVV